MRSPILLLSLAMAPFAFADWELLGMGPTFGTIGGGDRMKIITNFTETTGDCNPFPCGYFPLVMFGTVEARSAVNINGTVDVITPAHPRGTVPLTISFEGETPRLIGEFRFLDARDGLPFPNYERLLVPVYAGGAPSPGANGSLWTSELWVTNRGQHRVEILHPSSLCFENCAAGAFPGIEPGETKKLEIPDDDLNAAHVLYAQFAGLDDLTFSLRIRDVSHAEKHHGTEIPIVRISQLKSKTTVLNVPIDNTARTALRIYSPFIGEADVRVNMYSLSGPEILHSKVVRIHKPFGNTTAGLAYVAYGFVPDLQNELPAGSYRIELVTADFLPMYALASVTNNRTQLVTAIPSN